MQPEDCQTAIYNHNYRQSGKGCCKETEKPQHYYEQNKSKKQGTP
jgi:hypothetical protein